MLLRIDDVVSGIKKHSDKPSGATVEAGEGGAEQEETVILPNFKFCSSEITEMVDSENIF
jgi:hypothetical protein